MHSDDLKAEQFLDNIKVKDICRAQHIVAISATDSISKAMETLAKKEITGAPIWDNEKKHFIGFVDTLDLTMFVAYVFFENYQRHPHLYDPKELQNRFSLPVTDVINASKRDPFWTVDANESVGFLLNNFLKVGIHRVPVVSNSNLIGIVSQSDVVRLLAKNKQLLGDLANKTMAQLGLDQKPVVTVKNDESIIKAFNTILANDITGLAVVDMSNGRFINNLSASDLKGVTEQNFFKLEAQIHQIFMSNYSKKPPVFCYANTTLGEVISMIEKSGVHRVYVLNEHNAPIGVVTLTDIMRAFSRPTNPLDI